MTDAKNYWNTYYKDNVHSAGYEPSAFLAKNFDKLQQGRVLDVAMGEGANAVFLCKKGFEVDGFDLSEVAIERALNLAEKNGVKLNAKVSDADMHLLGVMEYDSVIMLGFKPDTNRFFPEIIKSMKQGATLFIESKINLDASKIDQDKQTYKPQHFKTNELLNQFINKLNVMFYQEETTDTHKLVQLIAEKPLDSDALKYGLFNMHTKTNEPKKSDHMILAESLFKS